MCLIVFAWRPNGPVPLLVAANRDEFYARPSLPLGQWPDVPGLHAGRDLEAGGTWLGIAEGGRFAALTNIRDPQAAAGARSRGELVKGFLAGPGSIEDYAEAVAGRIADYSGFNLLLGDGSRLGYFSSAEPALRWLDEGVYGLSNAGLDTPWPKVRRARQALADRMDDGDDVALLDLLADDRQAADGELPETGVGVATERLLSSIFIASAHYGTRASTVVRCMADGSTALRERTFGPQGARLQDVELYLRG